MPEQGEMTDSNNSTFLDKNEQSALTAASIRYNEFLERLKENCKNSTDEQVSEILKWLSSFVYSPRLNISFYTDRSLGTFVCSQVPVIKIDDNNRAVIDPNRDHYLIGIPDFFVRGNPPQEFLKGEIYHEIGHAQYTDWSLMGQYRETAITEGYSPEEITGLLNCVEDPRMERVMGGPYNQSARDAMRFKNELFIIPNIAMNINEATPPEQFRYLLKLEGLWNIYVVESGNNPDKPWSINDLNEDVQVAFRKVEQFLLEITGTNKKSATKKSEIFKKIFIEHIWSDYKQLIDKYPDNSGEDQQDRNEENQSKGNENNHTPELKKSARSPNGQKMEAENSSFNPYDKSTWPKDLVELVEKKEGEYEKEMNQKAHQQVAERQERIKAIEQSKERQHSILQQKDGFSNPELRIRYNDISQKMTSITDAIRREFQKLFPRTEEPEVVYGRSGTRLYVQKLVKGHATGEVKPLGKKENPLDYAFMLQLIVDVSGSMEGENINKAIEACISLAEAAEGANVFVEILASDDINVASDQRYLIKPFNGKFDGLVKEKILEMLSLTGFGGGNKDAESILAASARMEEALQKKQSQYDNIGSLIVFITDSTERSPETIEAVKEVRVKLPLEGLAVTSDPTIVKCIKYNYGEESIIPQNHEGLPIAMRDILKRHLAQYRRQR